MRVGGRLVLVHFERVARLGSRRLPARDSRSARIHIPGTFAASAVAGGSPERPPAMPRCGENAYPLECAGEDADRGFAVALHGEAFVDLAEFAVSPRGS